MITGVKEYVEITDKGLTIVNKDGKKETIEADTIVPALPLTAEHGPLRELSKKRTGGLRHRRLSGAGADSGCDRDGTEDREGGLIRYGLFPGFLERLLDPAE